MYKGNLSNCSVRKRNAMHLFKIIPIVLGYQLRAHVQN